MSQPDLRSLMLRLFLPFAAGYFLSYLYRTVNAVLGPVIAGELALPDNALGLLTAPISWLSVLPSCRWACCSTATALDGSKRLYWSSPRLAQRFLPSPTG